MAELKAAPVLSTPAEAILEFDPLDVDTDAAATPPRSDDELRAVYEVARTVREVRAAGWRCVGLQFPDTLLGEAPRVARLLERAWGEEEGEEEGEKTVPDSAATSPAPTAPKFYILADTAYSACCVDEVAAEHAGADGVVHYGRACLSPTTRLPVVYVFTRHALDAEAVAAALAREFPDPAAADARIVLMADVAYQDHVPAVLAALRVRGYTQVLATEVVHRPLGRIPNRRIVDTEGQEVGGGGGGEEGEDDNEDEARDGFRLGDYAVVHIATPPTSLLLALAVRVRAFFVYPAGTPDRGGDAALLATRSMGLLGRRYAKVLSMATAGIIGILVNTLSVRDYLAAVAALRARIAAAGKKSYLIVVGKLNPAKLANFAEIDGWVVVGCWESSLVEDDAGFYRPVVTPFELDLALAPDEERVWGVRWWGGLEDIVRAGRQAQPTQPTTNAAGNEDGNENDNVDSDDEIPQFDLRTGRLVTTSRPMRGHGRREAAAAEDAAADVADDAGTPTAAATTAALALRQKAGAVASIRGVVSPGAEFLRSQRTWQGLGSDFHDEDADPPSTAVEEGRSGIARGYTLGDDNERT